MIISNNYYSQPPSTNFHLISFGSDENYVELSLDLVKKIHQKYPDSSYFVYEKTDLPEELIQYGDNHKKGYGYWRWKPFIVNLHIQKYGVTGQNFIYIDGRTDFISDKITWLEHFIYIDKEKFFLAWCLEMHEYLVTKNELLKFMGLSNSNQVLYSGQFAATFFAFEINSKTRLFFDSWLKLSTHSNLINDEIIIADQNSEFRFHRHDQSMFSLLLKTSDFFEEKLIVITQSQTDLKAHAKPHPINKNLLYYIKKPFPVQLKKILRGLIYPGRNR